MKDNEKTVGVAVSASCAALYDQFPHFKTDAKTFQTGNNRIFSITILYNFLLALGQWLIMDNLSAQSVGK